MGIDREAIAGDKDRYKTGEGGGGSFFSPQEGEVKIFLCPPARGAGLPYYAAAIHYTGDAGVVCTDALKNPILKDPIFTAALKADGKAIPSSCPLCAKGDKPSVKFLFVVMPLQIKGKSDPEFKRVDPIECRPYLAPKAVWNGIADILLDVGDSVVDPNGPVFIKIKREGKTKTNTKYTVIADTKTLREQKPLPKAVREMVAEALAEGGSVDPYKILVRMFKSGDELSAASEGLEVDESGDGMFDDETDGEKAEKPKPKVEPKAEKPKPKAEPKAEKPKPKAEGKAIKRAPCFAIDFNADDTACQSCKVMGECKAEFEAKSGGGDDDTPEVSTGEDGGTADGGNDDDLDALLG